MTMNTTLYQSINAQDCCFNMRKISRAVTQYFDRHLEPAGLRATQFTLLVTLASSHAKTLTEMAEGLVMDRTTLTRNLRPIEKLELITSVTVNDKRSKAYALTPKGHEVLKESIPLWEHAQKKIVDSVTPDRYIRILNELVLLKTATFTPKEKINKYKSQNAD